MRRTPGRGDEVLLDLLGLTGPQQAVVDEHAGQLLADGALHERGRDGGVDTAGQPADHPGVAHLGADQLDLVGDDVARRPGRREPGAAVQEVLQRVLAEQRVLDLGVPLHAVEATGAVLEGRDGRAGRRREHREPCGGLVDGVAVAHPDLLRLGRAGEEDTGVGDLDGGAAVLADARLRDRSAERLGHHLEAVADAQHGHACLEQGGVHPGSALGVDAGGAARQDHRRGVPREHLLDAPGVRDDLGVHVRLTDASRDELGVLGAEVDDEDGAVAGGRGGRGHAGSLVTDASLASPSRCTRRSRTKLITGTTPARTIVTSLPKRQRIVPHRSRTVTR